MFVPRVLIVDDSETETAFMVQPGFGMTLGFTLLYLCLIVLIPLITLPARTASMGPAAIWQTITDPRVVASYRLSVGAALAAAGVTGCFRTAEAPPGHAQGT